MFLFVCNSKIFIFFALLAKTVVLWTPFMNYKAISDFQNSKGTKWHQSDSQIALSYSVMTKQSKYHIQCTTKHASTFWLPNYSLYFLQLYNNSQIEFTITNRSTVISNFDKTTRMINALTASTQVLCNQSSSIMRLDCDSLCIKDCIQLVSVSM